MNSFASSSGAKRRGENENRVGWNYGGKPLSTKHQEFTYEHVIVSKLAGGDKQQESVFLTELTERELEVLSCMARGLSNSAIAQELFIQPRTVERHIGSIFSKMRLHPQPNAHARVQAVLAFLQDTGLLKASTPVAA